MSIRANGDTTRYATTYYPPLQVTTLELMGYSLP